MKITVKIYGKTTETHEMTILTDPHNVRYLGVNRNHLTFAVLRYPKKSILTMLQTRFPKTEIQLIGMYIQATIKHQRTLATVLIRARVLTPEDIPEFSGQIIRETVETFSMEVLTIPLATKVEKEELAALLDPHVYHVVEANPKREGKLYLDDYGAWAHPIDLCAMVDRLDYQQKMAVARFLAENFKD